MSDNETADASKWSPRPDEGCSLDDRKGYHAGYSDAFHGYRRGAAYADSRPASYDHGYDDAKSDLAVPAPGPR